MPALVKIFHLASLSLYIYVTHFLYAHGEACLASDNKLLRNIGELRNRFLTNWTYVIQLFYFVCCVLAYFFDILPPTRKITISLNSWANDVFTTIVLPMGFMVSLVFWGIYFYDRNLIFPNVLGKTIPPYINHSIHSFNSIIPIIDMFLVHHTFPSWNQGIKVITAYLGAYVICLFGTYFQKGIWIYPLFKELTWPQIGIFCILNLFIAYLLFGFSKLLNNVVWDKTKPFQHVKQRKNNKHKSNKFS